MAAIGCVPGRQCLPAFGATENHPVERQHRSSWQFPRVMPHAGEEKHIFLLWVLLVSGLRNDGVFQSKISVGKQNMETSNDGSDEHPKASEDQWQNMKFDHLQKETHHIMQAVLRNIIRPLFLSAMIS